MPSFSHHYYSYVQKLNGYSPSIVRLSAYLAPHDSLALIYPLTKTQAIKQGMMQELFTQWVHLKIEE